MARPLNKTELDICGRLLLHIRAAEDRVKVLNLEKVLKLIPDRELAQATVEDIKMSKDALGRILITLEKLIDDTPKESGQTPWKPGSPPVDDILSVSSKPKEG